MWVQVRYFAAVREIIGDTAARWELPQGATVGDLWGRLAAANPPLRELTCTAAVNQEYVSPGDGAGRRRRGGLHTAGEWRRAGAGGRDSPPGLLSTMVERGGFPLSRE